MDEDGTSNGESPDSDAGCFEDDDGSLSQVALDGTEVRHQEVSHLAGPTLSTSAEQDKRGKSVMMPSEEHAEIGIRGNQDTVLSCRPVKDRRIICSLETKFTDMHSIVAHFAERHGDVGRKRVVHEKFHAVGRSGSSRSRTASAA